MRTSVGVGYPQSSRAVMYTPWWVNEKQTKKDKEVDVFEEGEVRLSNEKQSGSLSSLYESSSTPPSSSSNNDPPSNDPPLPHSLQHPPSNNNLQ
jgi:hypothetical protein